MTVQTKRAIALARVQNDVATASVNKIEHIFLEWVREWSTDNDARDLACQVEHRMESGV